MSLLANYNLDEASGTTGAGSVVDATGNGNAGTPTAVTFGSSGIPSGGTSATFNGTSSVIVLPAFSVSAITCECWVKLSSLANAYTGVIGRNGASGTNPALLYVKSSGKLAIYINTGGSNYDGTGTYTLTTGVWYHIAFTYDATNGLIGYVNGQVDKSVGAAGGLAASSAPFHIGDDPAFSGRFLSGSVDNAKIYDNTQSAAYMLSTYTAGSASGTSSLLLRRRRGAA